MGVPGDTMGVSRVAMDDPREAMGVPGDTMGVSGVAMDDPRVAMGVSVGWS